MLPSTLIYPYRAGDIRALADSCFYTRLESAADRAFGAQRFSGGRSGRRFAPPSAGLRGFKRKQFRQAKLKQFALTSNSLARAGLGRGWARLGEAGRGWARLGQAGPGLGQGWARAGPELDQAGVRMRGLGEWGWASRFQGQNHEPQFQNCEAQPPNPEAQSQNLGAQTRISQMGTK